MKFRLGKTITLVFVTCALQAYAIAGPVLMGKLRTRDNKPVVVNGNKASSGTTLLSGSQIQSPEKIGATVDLGPLGRLDMGPKTDLTLNFSATEISVQLKSGCAVLTTKKGISGRVTTSEGQVFQTDSSKLSSVLARTKDCEGPETALPIGAAAGGLGAGGTAGVAGTGAAVVGGTAAAKAGGRGAALSGDNPRQP